MNANTLRVYTILPPPFYRALRAWNLGHPDRTLWLVHGVWTELPPDHDFDDAAGSGGFRSEMRDVVDVVHGSVGTSTAPRPRVRALRRRRITMDPGVYHRAGVGAVCSHRLRLGTPGDEGIRGRYLEVERAPAMDVWMAEQCDFLLSYEADEWNALRPIAYTNWPTLDPLAHPTEAGGQRRAAVARAIGPLGDRRKTRIRERRHRPGRQPCAAHASQSRRVVRQLPRVSLLPGLPALRSRLQPGPLERRSLELLRLPQRLAPAPRGNPLRHLRVRGTLEPGQRPFAAPGLESRRPRRDRPWRRSMHD